MDAGFPSYDAYMFPSGNKGKGMMEGIYSIFIGLAGIPLGYFAASLRSRYKRSQRSSGVSLWR
jgi:hypothetical protein